MSNQKMEKYEDFAQGGILTHVHIGRSRCEGKIEGVKGQSSHEFVRYGKIQFLPPETESRLQKIEGAVRYQLRKMSLTDNYLILKDYKEYKEFFEQKQEEFFCIRDEIYENWADIVSKYKDNLQKVNHLVIKEAYIPNKESYKRSFYMDLETSMLPMFDIESLNENFNSIKDELKKSNKAQQERFVTEIQIKSLNELIEIVNSFMRKENGSKQKFSRKGAEKKIEKMQENSYFSTISKSIELIMDLLDSKNKHSIDTLAESTLVKIYKIAKEKGFEKQLSFKDSVVSAETLDLMADMLSAEDFKTENAMIA